MQTPYAADWRHELPDKRHDCAQPRKRTVVVDALHDRGNPTRAAPQ
jgi:hypothetical protein